MQNDSIKQMQHLLCYVAFVLFLGLCTSQCPPELQSIANTSFNVNMTNYDAVSFSLCGTFNAGCYTPEGGQICTGPGCCSVCERWNPNQPNSGAACWGKYVSYVKNDSMIVLKYEFGDPVPPPGPPDPGPREAFIFISCGGNAPVGAWTYDQYPPKDGPKYQFWLMTSSSLCGSPSSGNLDPGFPRSLEFPGIFADKQLVNKGVAVAVHQPRVVFWLNVTITCGDPGCKFKVMFLDDENFQLFLTNGPYRCQNQCENYWANYDYSYTIAGIGTTLNVVIVPKAPTMLALQVMMNN